MAAIGFKRHNHTACAEGTIATAEAYCHAEGLKFTPTRRRVLEILLEGHRPLGAYDILERLAQEGRGSQPSIAYRALDFLLTHGFAHKVERLNAYIACAQPLEAHTPAFMICRGCKSVAEAASTPAKSPIGKAAREAGFKIEQTVVEAEGLCPNCQRGGEAA
ncbi:MAG: Fur family transcriptional regulator [Kiloniellaceae bacterium]